MAQSVGTGITLADHGSENPQRILRPVMEKVPECLGK